MPASRAVSAMNSSIRSASSGGNSPTSRNVSTWRSGITTKCASACGLMSRIATNPSTPCTWSPSAYNLQNRQSSGSENPLLRDSCGADTNEPAGFAADEPGRVIVTVAAPLPIDEHDVLAAELRPPVLCACESRLLAQACASLLLHQGGDGIGVRSLRSRPRRVWEHVQLRQPRIADHALCIRERALVFRRKPDDHVGGEIEILERRQPAQVRRGCIAASHRTQHPVVA